MAISEQELAAIKARLRELPRGPWYVERERPGREDEARVYDGGHWGVCKPTPNNQHYRRPIAEFVAHAQEDVPALVAEVERLRKVHADLETENLRLRQQHDRDWEINAELRQEIATLKEPVNG